MVTECLVSVSWSHGAYVGGQLSDTQGNIWHHVPQIPSFLHTFDTSSVTNSSPPSPTPKPEPAVRLRESIVKRWQCLHHDAFLPNLCKTSLYRGLRFVSVIWEWLDVDVGLWDCLALEY